MKLVEKKVEDFGKKSEVVYPTRTMLFQHLPGSVGGKMEGGETGVVWVGQGFK